MNLSKRRSERGISLVAAAIWLAALAVIAAVAIDTARLSHTASEMQGIADAAALAGAKAVLENGGTAGPEQTAAFAVANQNSFNGTQFPLSNNSSANMVVEAGNFDPTLPYVAPDWGFVSGGTPTNAVRATATGLSIPYVAAAIVGPFLGQTGTSSASVTKQATAAFGCGNNCQPSLPLAICADVVTTVPSNQICQAGDLNVSPITQQPATGVSCLTSLSSTSSANDTTEVGDLPAVCGGGSAPVVAIGQQILVQNGQSNNFFHNLRTCVAPLSQGGQNQHIFRLPVIASCNGCTGSQTVTDFIALRIGCTDPACTDSAHCDCPGAFNTWNTAVVDSGSNKGIFNAVEVCDNTPCGSVVFSKTTCGPYRGTVLVH